MEIRPEQPGDGPAIRRVNELAFGGPAEADLVESLRQRGAVLLSLVAVGEAEVIGHALFTVADVVSAEGAEPIAALGPMAVLPGHQRGGVGGRLLRRGLELLRAEEHRGVVVLGHPGYYPKFGFAPAGEFGISCEFDVPDEVFMAIELQDGALANCPGRVRYQPEFNNFE